MTIKLTQALILFEQHLAVERKLSGHTVKNYLRDLEQLIEFCQLHGLTQWSELKAVHIRQFASRLHQRELSARTIQRMLSSVRTLFHFLLREGVVDANPALTVQAPKTKKRLPATLDIDQVNALLEHTEQHTFIGCRDRAIMELFYSSGLRLAELAGLNRRDIDFADRLVYVTGKGNKERVCPLGSQAIAALKNWLAKRDERGFEDQPALFISRQGRRLGVRSIQQRLAYWGKKTQISAQVHPHRLRHAFASHMLEASGDLRAVQELLGHADISTTQIYTHVDFQHLVRVYDAVHPRAKKNKSQ